MQNLKNDFRNRQQNMNVETNINISFNFENIIQKLIFI